MKIPSKTPGLLLALLMTARVFPASADTLAPYTLSYTNLVAGEGPLAFSLPRFDPSLGSLQSVDITCDFYGTILGSATGVSQSSSMNGTITHHVFFNFTDISDHVFIAEPALSLTAAIPAGAQNTAISFGPEYQSSNFSFSVTAGDPRFDAWVNGPGDFSGNLSVYFTNTTQSFSGVEFFPGNDTGEYSGTFSVVYSYEPVPEPGVLTLAAAGLLLMAFVKHERRKAA